VTLTNDTHALADRLVRLAPSHLNLPTTSKKSQKSLRSLQGWLVSSIPDYCRE
jgi:hypothetical protein